MDGWVLGWPVKMDKRLNSTRGGKSGRFRELNSQKILSKTRFDRKYLGKLYVKGSLAY